MPRCDQECKEKALRAERARLSTSSTVTGDSVGVENIYRLKIIFVFLIFYLICPFVGGLSLCVYYSIILPHHISLSLSLYLNISS